MLAGRTRRSDGKWVVGLVIVWIASLAVAFWFGQTAAERKTGWGLGRPVTPVPVAIETAKGGDAQSVALREENEELRERILRLEAELKEPKGAKQTTETTPTARERMGRASKEAIRERWQIWRDRGSFESDNQMFPNIENTLGLMFDLVTLGEAGLDCLIDVANDPKATDQEKEFALEGISFWPKKKALKVLLSNKTVASENRYVDFLWRQVTCLPTSDLREDMPTLERLLLPEIGEGTKAHGKEAQVLASLAFVHGSENAARMVYDPDAWQEPNAMLGEADLLHTDAAKEYVERVAERHSNIECRRYARQILQQWNER